ncbi:type II toxin-antitoxin system VapC family toxin [Caldilinea sp.]|uniref:type II toxin-antitoxin system VapC family toxin n=1 Tax=Caldilinea sp. TaxID=2293560 RepID=UPI002C65FD8D|nr:type II toxin-antitoxin system VapC family toxin [Caldilinea sp.]
MVIDSSAILAILEDETEAELFAEKIAAATERWISAASLLESAIVVEIRHGPAGSQKLDELLIAAQVQVEPVTLEQVAVARLAYRVYGKGRHAAGLNFGDCFVYALAKLRNQPLLFKGNDFSQTDLQLA